MRKYSLHVGISKPKNGKQRIKTTNANGLAMGEYLVVLCCRQYWCMVVTNDNMKGWWAWLVQGDIERNHFVLVASTRPLMTKISLQVTLLNPITHNFPRCSPWAPPNCNLRGVRHSAIRGKPSSIQPGRPKHMVWWKAPRWPTTCGNSRATSHARGMAHGWSFRPEEALASWKGWKDMNVSWDDHRKHCLWRSISIFKAMAMETVDLPSYRTVISHVYFVCLPVGKQHLDLTPLPYWSTCREHHLSNVLPMQISFQPSTIELEP